MDLCLCSTCGTQETVLFLFPCLAHIDDAQQTLVIGGENIPLKGVLDGSHVCF